MENPSDSKFMSPLLADLLDTASHDHPLILVQMFLSNGRHAGPDGDVARICQSSGHPCIHITEPVLDHSMIIELLAKRAYEALP
jgi:sirohydrochlorin ferrochelatase